MRKYVFLALVYLVCLFSYGVANYFGQDVQNYYRLPFLNVKWIDIAIILVAISFFYNSTKRIERLSKTNLIITLCFIYLIFEGYQLYLTWGYNDAASQISRYLCTLSLFIVIDLSVYSIPTERINNFLKLYGLIGAVVLLVSNLYLLYSFVIGNVVLQDLDIRVAIEVEGSKETIYSTVLTPYVYAFGLYTLSKESKLWQKMIYLAAILSIYGTIIITFYRGTFVTIVIISLYFIVSSKKGKQTFATLFALILLLGVGNLIFGSFLSKKGYDPIEKIAEVARFTTDVNNPHWDKGRSISQDYAIKAWLKNPWFGAGYDELLHYGLPEGVATAHNGIITSLFHRGIIGTILLMSILVLLFKYPLNLWFILKRENNKNNDQIKLLIFVSFFWIISFMTQEALWEKFSLSIQYLYLGLILNIYKQKVETTNIIVI